MHATTRSWVIPATFAFLAAFPLVATREARADPPPIDPGQHFAINPVADGVLTLAGAGFSSLLGLILATGEIEATAPGPASNLLSIDRGAVTQKFDKSAGPLSDAALWTGLGFAALDPLLSGLRAPAGATAHPRTDGACRAVALSVAEASMARLRRTRSRADDTG